MENRQGLGGTVRGDAGVALALASVLGLGWTFRAAADLTRLNLPDTDDVMRLQQVRDWLAGQAFGDVTQHRLGHGLPMHWSRLADLVPGGTIRLLAPLIGRHAAEVATVTLWPLILFAVAIFLVARLARAVGVRDPRVAAVVAAIAYPATTVFLPGRIDHHGLQLVLLLGAALATMGRASAWTGAVAGLLSAASLVIGLETAVVLAALGAVMLADWVLGLAGSRVRLAGLASGALAGLIAARLVFAGSAFGYPACDGFTSHTWRAAVVLSLIPVVPALVPGAWWPVWRRLAVAGVVLAAGAAGALLLSPDCLSPYGQVDPLLARLWLANVEEAQPLFASFSTAIGYGGVMVAGLAAAGWRWWAERSRGWALLCAVQAAALLVAVAQARGAYAGAMLAAPALAAAIGQARLRGGAALIGTWLVSAGMLYPLAASALVRTPRSGNGAIGGEGCDAPALLARLAALPPGTVMAPIDAGPWIIAVTPHRVVAAPYHRNTDGNLAMFRFFLGRPGDARAIAARWQVRYVVACRSGMRGTPDSLLHQLSDGDAPAWLRPLPRPGVYAVVR